MKDIVLIKLYRNEFSDNDYHDWMIDRYPLFAEELKKHLQERGKSFYLMCLSSDTLNGAPCNGNPFAEIEYTGSLTQEEKQNCLETLKKLSSDLEWYQTKNGRKKETKSREFSTLTLVKIRKIKEDEELLELSECEVDCADLPISEENE